MRWVRDLVVVMVRMEEERGLCGNVLLRNLSPFSFLSPHGIYIKKHRMIMGERRLRKRFQRARKWREGRINIGRR